MSESNVSGNDITESLGEMTKKAGSTFTNKATAMANMFTSSGMDEIMQVICMLLLALILVIVNPANTAVMYMRKGWALLLALVFFLCVLYVEKDKPRVSILLGLVIVALIIYSDVGYFGESFYGKVPDVQQQSETVQDNSNDNLTTLQSTRNENEVMDGEQDQVQPSSTNVEEQYAAPF